MNPARHLSDRVVWIAIATVIAAVVAVGLLTNITLRSVEKDLPRRLSSELYHQSTALEHLSSVIAAATIAKALPNQERIEALIGAVDIVHQDIVQLRESYVFDNLLPSSAFHAAVAPAIVDSRIWLSEGISGYGPRSETSLAIVVTRLKNAFRLAKGINRRSRDRSQEILENLRGRLDNFLVNVNVLFSLTFLVSVFLVLSQMRQQRLRRQEELARDKIHEQSDLINHLFESIALGITVWSAQGELLHANNGFTRITGYGGEDIPTLDDWFRKAHPDPMYRASVVEQWTRANRHSNTIREFNVVCRNGDVKVIEFRGVYLDDGRGLVTLADITDRKKVEDAIRKSEEKYRLVMEGSPDPVVVYDMQGHVIYLNPAFTKVFGWTLEELQGGKIDYVPNAEWPATRAMLDRMIRGERYQGFETRRYTKTGDTVDISMSFDVWRDDDGNRTGSVVVLHDVTEQKKLESQLQQAIKMESIGTLAGGIAHDFNNILSAILGYSELSLADLPPQSPLAANVKAIHRAGERARDLVTQILSFSRKDDHMQSPVRVKQVIDDALKLLRPAIPSSIEIQTTIVASDFILGDPTRIQQVVMNLCTNAYQAMQKNGGLLHVSLMKTRLEEGPAATVQLTAGSYLELTISDTGSGIDPENMKRIFDPYFTTKEKGKGTGLGLAAVHGIVKSHGGAIKVKSRIGKGTMFTIYLPVLPDARPLGPAERQVLVGGNEHILLVDDEQAVLEVTKNMLQKLGYTTTERTDPRDALECFSQSPDGFDLLVTDMTMPGMTGDKLAREIRAIRTAVPVILCTGFSEQISKEKAADQGIDGYLLKPVALTELSLLVRRVLDKKPG